MITQQSQSVVTCLQMILSVGYPSLWGSFSLWEPHSLVGCLYPCKDQQAINLLLLTFWWWVLWTKNSTIGSWSLVSGRRVSQVLRVLFKKLWPGLQSMQAKQGRGFPKISKLVTTGVTTTAYILQSDPYELQKILGSRGQRIKAIPQGWEELN